MNYIDSLPIAKNAEPLTIEEIDSLDWIHLKDTGSFKDLIWATLQKMYEDAYELGNGVGYDEGVEHASTSAWEDGHEAGSDSGYREGYDDGYSEGFSDGKDEGLALRDKYESDAYYRGVSDGMDQGFDKGMGR